MEAMALELQGVTKQYGDFTLDHVSFTVPKGSIVGLIGENGAGKSTTINAVLGLIHTQEGTVRLLGSRGPEEVNREEMGVVFDGNNYPTMLTPRQMGKVFPGLYRSWDEEKYREILERFQIPANKKIKEFSKGMKMKYSIAVAFSHHVKLLILDEATSGLDPIMRDEVLDMLLEFIQDEDHAFWYLPISPAIWRRWRIISSFFTKGKSFFPVLKTIFWKITELSNAAPISLPKSARRISCLTGNWTVNGRCWWPIAMKRRRSTPRRWWCRLRWMRSCCCT